MNRQQKWQQKKHAQGNCTVCGKKKINAYYCLEHALKAYWQQRRLKGIKKPSSNCKVVKAAIKAGIWKKEWKLEYTVISS